MSYRVVIPRRFTMSPFRLLIAAILFFKSAHAQYNTQQPYDQYDRNNPQPPYNPNGPYDRNNPPPYDRNNNPLPPYDRNNPAPLPYDRNNPAPPYANQPYNNTQYNYDNRYGNNSQYNPFNSDNRYGNNSQYDRYNNPPPYDGRYSNDPRFSNYSNQGQQPYDRYNQSNNRDQFGNTQYGNNRDQYGNNRDQYGNNRDQFGNNRDQYGNNRDQFGNNRDQLGNTRDQFGNTRDQFGNNRDQIGNNRDQYGSNRDQFGSNRDQFGNNRDQFGGNRDQFGNNRDRFGSNRDQYGGQQYGSPLSDTNDNCCRDYCYSQDSQPYLNFATKTAYQIVYGKHSNQHKVPDCTPIQFWSINRHGTKLPGARTIARLRQLTKIHDDIVRNYDERRSYPDRGRLCPGDLDLFRRWRWNETISEQNANMLTAQGTMDLKYLARRYMSRFEEIFREPYSDQAYNFQYTDTDRTHDSYQAYIEGLFRGDAFRVHANVFRDDRLIKPTAHCNAYQDQVEFNPQTSYQYEQFKRRPEYQEMVRHVFRRLGFRYTLNDSIIDDMYDLCRLEKAWELNQPSPWCMVFNTEQLKLLEYAQDLKYYYKAGYGNEINKRVGCPPLKDLFEKFERTVNGQNTGNKATVFFTHSITIQTFLTAMGIAKDRQPLTADNYYQQQRREWRTSIIDPFASNLAATLYECRSGERHRVMFFLNEVPVNYPECSVGLCNWNTVREKLQYAAQSCNLDFCDGSAATSLRTNLVYLSLVFFIGKLLL